MAYAVTWIEAPEARAEHLAVWERNLALPVDARQRFTWLYRDNPAGAGRLAVLEARNPGAPAQVVGTAGYALRSSRVDGGVRTVAVLADLAVDRSHRTAMPAIMLARELRRQVLERHDLVYAFPNDQAAPLLLKLGYRKLADTRRFALLLHHRRHLSAMLSRPTAARLGALGLDLGRAALVLARAASASIDHRLEWVTDADARFDSLWAEASADHAAIGVRDAAFVRWRFLSCPDGQVKVAALIRRGSGVLDGYAAVARSGATVHVRDLFARAGMYGPLLKLLSAAVVRQGADSISVRLCGAPAVVAALQAQGFRERADKRTVIVDTTSLPEPARAAVLDPDRWHITDADEDA